MIAFDAPATWPPAVLPDAFAAVQTVETLRCASAVYHTAASDSPASTTYQARILNDVEVGATAFDDLGIGGRVALTLSDVTLWNGRGALNDVARYDTAAGRSAWLRTVPVTAPAASHFGTPLASASLAFAGSVRAVTPAADRRVLVSLSDITSRLNVPLQPSRYLGTGGLEGPSTLTGRPKPVCLGRVLNISPVLLGNIDLGDGALPTYQTHWRSMAGHDVARIRGVTQTRVTSAPTVGQFRDWPALGCFQLGSTPDGVVTADAQGDDVGGYVSSTALVVKRLAMSLAPAFADSDFDATAFAFADTDLAGEMGWFQGAADVSAVDALGQIVAACGGVLAGGRNGLLRLFDPLAAAPAQFDVAEAHLIALEPQALPAALHPLARTVAVGYARNWTPTTNLASGLDETTRAQLAGSGAFARADSATITARVAQQRELKFPGLYAASTDALRRAGQWRDWVQHGPRAFDVTTDRLLGQVELGDICRLAAPSYGLTDTIKCVVLGWRENLSARRLRLTLVTVAEA